jgi:hypothetical protein
LSDESGAVQHGKTGLPMSQMGQKATYAQVNSPSALPSIADIERQFLHIGFGR